MLIALVLETFCSSRMSEHRPISVTTQILPDQFMDDLKGRQIFSVFVSKTPACMYAWPEMWQFQLIFVFRKLSLPSIQNQTTVQGPVKVKLVHSGEAIWK